jgi:hypothetical protein
LRQTYVVTPAFAPALPSTIGKGVGVVRAVLMSSSY